MQSRCRVSQNWSHILTEKAISMVAALSASAQEAYVGLTIRHSTSYSNTWQLLNPVTDGDHSGGFSYGHAAYKDSPPPYPLFLFSQS
ncbi:hypothetical protein ACFX13_022037 [Malus domestica]|uniref:Uncharacterized protein n=1 Tax=Malus domestica TaxID=3750 RepID=A0A498HQG2_MALDO|nr:hypothetical protein DVH24_025326 [Malus domestica]RXI09583.1 hypothetical protein DVH24_032733 [Malus domestica]